MTSERCSDVRGDLVAHVRGELSELASARVEAHVRRCPTCRAARSDLELGLAAARDVAPVTLPELASLAQRVSAAAPAHRPFAFGAFGLGAGAFALAAAVVVVIAVRSRGDELAAGPSPPPSSSPTSSPIEPELVERVSVEPARDTIAPAADALAVARAAPSSDVRMLSGASFTGAVETVGDRVVVDHKSGFAVFAFRGSKGGKKRSMEVRTGAGTVQVVGTLFFVDVDAGVTRIGVDRGKVIVKTAHGEHTVGAGQRFALDASGPVPVTASAAEPFLADEELVAFHDAELSGARIEASEARKGANVADRIVEAERMAREGRPADARARLVTAVRDPAYARSVDLLRYEIARLDGLALGDLPRARAALKELTTTARASLRVQSTLTLCELDLADNRCEARACLARARTQGGSVAEEAGRLEQRWSLAELSCATR